MKHSVSTMKTTGGLPILFIDIPGTSSVDLAIATRSGYRFATKENINQYECPHVLEHLIFEGSEAYNSYDELQQIFTNGGGDSNGTTDGYHTTFIFHTRPRQLTDVLKAALDIVYRPKLPESGFFEELQVIQNELEDNMGDLGMNVAMYTQQQVTPDYVQSTDTQLDRLGNVTLKEVKAYHSRYYTQQNSDIIIAANFKKVSKQEIIATIEASLKGIKRGTRLDFPAFAVSSSNVHCVPIPMNKQIADTIVSVNFVNEKPASREQMMQLGLFTTLATNMKTYSVNFKMRKRGYLYQLDISPFQSVESHGISIGVAASHKRFAGSFAYILEELRKLANDGISKEQFEAARDDLINSLEDASNSPESIMEWYMKEYLVEGTFNTPEEDATILRKISQQSVLKLAQQLIQRPKSYSTVFSARSARAAVTVDDLMSDILDKNKPVTDTMLEQRGEMLGRESSWYRRLQILFLALIGAAIVIPFFVQQQVATDLIFGTLDWWGVVVAVGLYIFALMSILFEGEDEMRQMQAWSFGISATLFFAGDFNWGKIIAFATSTDTLAKVHFWLAAGAYIAGFITATAGLIQWALITKARRRGVSAEGVK